MYYDAYEVYELLDKWNHRGPPNAQHVADLFQRDPDAAQQEFYYGQTLLHKCMEYYIRNMDLIKVLLSAYPEALSKEDDNGLIPLHRALICTGCPPPTLDLIQLFVNEDPLTILSTTKAGSFPLHLACMKGCTLDVVQFLAEYFPDVLQYRDKEGKFPLDCALDDNNGTKERIEVVKYLIDKYPVLLTFCDKEGKLPLHRVLKKLGSKSRNTYAHDTIVEILIDSCPGSLLFQDGIGQTPLLQACQDDNSLTQVYTLVRKWPEQVTTQTNLITEPDIFNGEMLPSTLSSKSIQVDRVKEWVRLHPDNVILNCDSQGRLPLHYAAVSSSDDALEIVRFLVEQVTDDENINNGDDDDHENPLSIQDNHGRLPLHYAAAASSSLEVIEYLVTVYPEGLIRADNDRRLPWHYADCARQDIVFERTCELYPDIDTNLDLVPDEIRWDVLQVTPDD